MGTDTNEPIGGSLTFRGAPLSALDLAPVAANVSTRQALLNSIALSRHLESLGYNRHWVAEHHNMPGVASSATSVLIAHLADATDHIRIGSGGVMLPNHSPLVIAEQFGTLEALHPGRIDLGIGRAPGTDPMTARALRRGNPQSGDDLPALLGELFGFFTGNFNDTHPFSSILASPGLGYLPAVWLLGSSGYSAQLAGYLGLPFCFAHHFSAEHTVPALDLYRESFRPSAVLAEPYSMIGVMTICGETDEDARRMVLPSDVSFIERRFGRRAQMISPEEAGKYEFTAEMRESADARNAAQAVGGPEVVAERLETLLKETGVNELMLSTSTYDPADRLASFSRVAALGERV
jgi:luciferase family oxidoreductase group 1